MTADEICRMRLTAQQLISTEFNSVGQLVSYMGALQAQDYAMAKWAIGGRLAGATDALIEKALNNKAIVRTHVLRPTWHFAAAQDIRWMLELTAAPVRKAMAYNNRALGLDDAVFKKCRKVIEKILRGKQLTREEIMQALAKISVRTDENRAAHIMLDAELSGLVCNGARREKQFTYALMDEVVPPAKPMKKEEALALLAEKYFTSHGPATLQDFTWWSGLPAGEAKAALAGISTKLQSAACENKLYWFSHSNVKTKAQSSFHFLPAFDEYMVSYKDRSAALDPRFSRMALTGNGIFYPVVVVNGKIKGVWKRSVVKNKVHITTEFFTREKIPGSALRKAAQRFAGFLQLEAELN